MVNKSLPIFAFRQAILEAVETHHVVVVTAETGAGKSTQVPQYLQEAGYNVVVTQPRRLAARSVAERVAEEMGVEFGSLVGYRTGYERQDSPETQVLFCTDGLQLVREITGYGKAQVLVIDEVHEWNINIETLVAWARKRLEEEAPFKVVLMSATLEASKLAAYFAEITGECPVIEVPGRLFPVEKSEKASYELAGTVKNLIEEGRNVLVFQPGKREITDTVSELEGTAAVVLPLHGELSPSEQRRVFQHYAQPKVVVSTNVAQTSVTIDDIDAVVDSGLERRVELVDGVEGLYLKPTSQADCEQRAGRAGRTKEGVYILCSDTSLSYRPEFPVAEIMRSRLDQVVLRLAVAGIDASELTFFHQPDRATITESKRTCIALGFMTQEGEVTKLGRKAAKLPVGVKVARMVLEGAERGCIDDVLTIAAIMEIGSLKARSGEWTRITEESESDLLIEMDLYRAAHNFSRAEMSEVGIFAKHYFKARELRSKLATALRGLVQFQNGGSREDVLRAVVAGMVDHLYEFSTYSFGSPHYKNGDGTNRQLARESVVVNGPRWVVGLPFDLQVPTRRGGTRTLNLIQWVSKVDPTWLVEVAPQLSATERRNYRYDGSQDLVVCDLVTKFNGQEIKINVVEGEGNDAVQALASALTNSSVEHPCVEHNRGVREEVEDLDRRWATKLGTIDSGDLTNWYESHLGTVHTLEEALKLDLNLTDADISDLLGVKDYAAERAHIKEDRPDTWVIKGKSYDLTYRCNWDCGVKIALPRTVVAVLAEEDLPSWEGMQTRVFVSDEDYKDLYITLPEQGLDALREQIEAARKSLAWAVFKADGHDGDFSYEVSYQDPMPELPDPEVWDAETNAYAYAAWVYYTYSSGDAASSTWYLHWFQTEAQASQVRKETDAKKHELDSDEYERRNFDELEAEARALWEQVESQMEQIDWNCYQSYGFTPEEASGSSWDSLRNQPIAIRKLVYMSCGSYPKPTAAKKALEQLQERISQALAYHAENETRRPAAEQALKTACTVCEQVASGTDAVSPDDCQAIQRLKDAAEAAFGLGDYIQAMEDAEKVSELAKPLHDDEVPQTAMAAAFLKAMEKKGNQNSL